MLKYNILCVVGEFVVVPTPVTSPFTGIPRSAAREREPDQQIEVISKTVRSSGKARSLRNAQWVFSKSDTDLSAQRTLYGLFDNATRERHRSGHRFYPSLSAR